MPHVRIFLRSASYRFSKRMRVNGSSQACQCCNYFANVRGTSLLSFVREEAFLETRFLASFRLEVTDVLVLKTSGFVHKIGYFMVN